MTGRDLGLYILIVGSFVFIGLPIWMTIEEIVREIKARKKFGK